MSPRKRSVHLPLGHGNPAEQRLSSCRMSMPADGFVDSEKGGRHEFVPDESGPMTDSIVALGKGWSVVLVIAIIPAVPSALIFFF